MCCLFLEVYFNNLLLWSNHGDMFFVLYRATATLGMRSICVCRSVSSGQGLVYLSHVTSTSQLAFRQNPCQHKNNALLVCDMCRITEAIYVLSRVAFVRSFVLINELHMFDMNVWMLQVNLCLSFIPNVSIVTLLIHAMLYMWTIMIFRVKD